MAGYETQSRPLLPSSLSTVPGSSGPGLWQGGFKPRGFDGRDSVNTGPGSINWFVSTAVWAGQRTRSYRSHGRGLEDLTVSQIIEESRNWMTPYDTGHEFLTEKYELLRHSHPSWYASGLNKAWIRFPLFPSHNSAHWGQDPLQQGLNAVGAINLGVGTTLLRRSMPDNPVANLTQFLAELVIDLPRLPFKELARSTTKVRKGSPVNAVGSEYLNGVFAWQPLVSDVLKICDAIVRSQDIINQYVRDSGSANAVRRRRQMDPIVSSSTSSLVDCWASDINRISAVRWSSNLYPNGDASSRKTATLTTAVRQDYRLSCAWSYFLHHEGSGYAQLEDIAQKARKVLGLKLDLELLWELAPWSWLADWFVNIGDIIALNSRLASDSLLLRYGYLTRKSTVDRFLDHPGATFWSGPTGQISLHFRYTRVERVRATPYGFGVKTGAFSANQFAILAALGMTNSPSRGMWG